MRFEEFEATAELLFQINPHIAKEGYSVDMLIAHMQSTAFMMEREGHNSAGTFGYHITVYRTRMLPTLADPNGELVAKATLSHFTVERYLKAIGDALRTDERGDNLIAVARDAATAECELAGIESRRRRRRAAV